MVDPWYIIGWGIIAWALFQVLRWVKVNVFPTISRFRDKAVLYILWFFQNDFRYKIPKVGDTWMSYKDDDIWIITGIDPIRVGINTTMLPKAMEASAWFETINKWRLVRTTTKE